MARELAKKQRERPPSHGFVTPFRRAWHPFKTLHIPVISVLCHNKFETISTVGVHSFRPLQCCRPVHQKGNRGPDHFSTRKVNVFVLWSEDVKSLTICHPSVLSNRAELHTESHPPRSRRDIPTIPSNVGVSLSFKMCSPSASSRTGPHHVHHRDRCPTTRSTLSGFCHGSCDDFVVEGLILFDIHVTADKYERARSLNSPLDDSASWVLSQHASIPNVGFLN
ncbi:hypothetical protein EVAR_43940_1 [Eumeta japonica]|uniref:Uncharacterized protein n=1 Tax=Eumeta variegata TaxID=151549 RepID=A0A4C1WQY4_EUMVA|nr:hypothetical protein EVAR_43940_1 [Eumeta japonica]